MIPFFYLQEDNLWHVYSTALFERYSFSTLFYVFLGEQGLKT